MGYTKVKAQKCLLKATNHTEPKCFTSIRHPGWFFFQEQGIFTHRNCILYFQWMYLEMGQNCGNHNEINKCLWTNSFSLYPYRNRLKILQFLICKTQPINHLSPYSELCYDCKQSLWKSINQVLEMHQNSAVAASNSTRISRKLRVFSLTGI
jgi:hypothetical protein